MKATCFLRSSVMYIEATIMSYFLASSAGNDAVPILGDDVALDLHLLAEREADLDVEATDLAGGIDEVEGRIGPLGADTQLGCRVRGDPGQHNQRGEGGDYYTIALHGRSPCSD